MAILRATDILFKGLQAVGASARHCSNDTSLSKRVRRFKACFGSHPLVIARNWHDLREIDTERNLSRYFMSLFWLKIYPTEALLACKFNLHEETVRLWCWFYAECLQVLSQSKVRIW